MSKSKLKADDIFFGLQKTHQNTNRISTEPERETAPAQAGESVVKAGEPVEQKVETAQPAKPAKKAAPEKKKRGPVANPDNTNRVSLNILVAPELKYTVVSVVNEMKMQGIKERYNITDFVIEAIEEKIRRTKKQLDMD